MFSRSPFATIARLTAPAAAIVAIVASTDTTRLVANTPTVDRHSSLSPSDSWDTFSAEITMRRHLLTSDGPSAEAPTVRYRWTRSQRATGWKSTIEITSVAAPSVRSANGPVLLDDGQTVVRIEDDEDGTPARVYNRHGDAIQLPSGDDRRVLGEPVAGSLKVPALPELAYPDATRPSNSGREWVDAFIATPSRKQLRRDALHNRFGRASGRVRNFDRFVSTDERHTVEVLADRTSALPIEINVARDGTLIAQSTIAYAPGTAGTLVRRSVRTEHIVSSDATRRAVASIELSNVRLERRGVR
jgi:hypothetical protein